MLRYFYCTSRWEEYNSHVQCGEGPTWINRTEPPIYQPRWCSPHRGFHSNGGHCVCRKTRLGTEGNHQKSWSKITNRHSRTGRDLRILRRRKARCPARRSPPQACSSPHVKRDGLSVVCRFRPLVWSEAVTPLFVNDIGICALAFHDRNSRSYGVLFIERSLFKSGLVPF